jgi:hypothetical protein
MPIPQVNDRIKEAPVVVLRAVFAGIGQILLTADKVRARAAEQAWTPDRATALGPSCRPAAAPPARGPRNGTLRSEPAVGGPAVAGPTVTEPAVTEPAAVTGPAVTEPAVAGPAVTEPAAVAEPPASREAPQGTGTAAQAAAPAAKATKTAKAAKTAKTVPAPRPGTAEPAAEAPPLPGYDDLSLASLRARLRVLDAAQIRAMLAYERAHARREPVITMLERRLAKITAG